MILENYLKKIAGYKLSKLRDIADEEFSRYVRLKNAWKSNSVLVNKCYTCNATKKVKSLKHGLDNGHFQTRNKIIIRYEEDNCRPQCTYCNKYRNGEQAEFERRLRHEIGNKKVERLYSIRNLLVHDERGLLLSVIAKYKPLNKERLKELGYRSWASI